MGLLDKLWDDTLAGPQPEKGLSKLRKYYSFSSSSNAAVPPEISDVPISRSITILRSSSLRSGTSDTSSVPSSPAGSSAPESPFAPTTPRGNVKKLRKPTAENAELKTVYDWIVMSALDR